MLGGYGMLVPIDGNIHIQKSKMNWKERAVNEVPLPPLHGLHENGED
jgi:hypothetical protein